jgi:hypothetical protein
MALVLAGLLLTALAGLLVWRVAERFWHIVAIAILAVPLMPLFALSITGDVSQYLPDWLASDADKDAIIVASVAATLLLAVIVATAVFGVGKLAWRNMRSARSRDR